MHNFSGKFTLIIFLILLKKITIIGFKFGNNNDINDDNVHSITKRMDLENCLSQFDTHRNMIIRTEESLAIGGKYLQGIGLETVEECRRLCCETELCDVFVFEEKSEGYCYLFECGPPENFRCKFTKHGNFTSAVLTPIRHIIEPPIIKPSSPSTSSQQQIIKSTQNVIVSQQERELINLKQKLNPKDKNSVVTTPSPAANHLVTTPKTISATISSCGRFQFQCHSGECIGIYNACNGIPQCEDGSDEGPECNVNTGGINNLKSSGIVSGNNNDLSNIMTNSRNKQNIIQTIPRQYQTQIVQSPIINNREDPMSAPQLWPPNRKISDSQVDLEPNIFNHKGGIQVPNVAQFPNQNPNIIYNQLPSNQRSPGGGIYMQPNDLQNQYRQTIIQPQDHIILPPNINWPVQQQLQQQQLQQPGNPYGININGQQPQQPQSPSSIKITQETIDMPQPNHVQSISGKNDQISSVGVSGGSEVASPTQTEKVDKENKVIDKNNSKESEEYIDYTETSTEAPKKKQRKHKKTSKDASKKELKTENKVDPVEKSISSSYHGQYRTIKDNLEMEFIDHDGYSERPGGAVLSLTLGILVAAALAILIGCKMRTVGRRVRRLGKTPLASDADFLVNGMYL